MTAHEVLGGNFEGRRRAAWQGAVGSRHFAFLPQDLPHGAAPLLLRSAIWPYNAVETRGESSAMAVFLACAGLLGLLGVALSFNVGRVRNKTKIFLGDGGNRELITAMRAQANFIENVPLGLILIGLLDPLGSNHSAVPVAVLSIVFLVARLLHAAGMLGHASYGRPAGAILTTGVLLISASWVGLSGLGRL
jgi:uncharacterized membrane protein YecN with MAPEG domain